MAKTADKQRPDGMPVGTPFKPGESGNPNGRPKSKPFTEELRRVAEEDDWASLKAIVKKALQKAKAGDFRYFKEIMERLDGKVLDRTDVTTGGQPLPGLTAAEMEKLAEMRGWKDKE